MKASVILSVIASVAFASYVPPAKSSTIAPVVTSTAPVYVPPAKSSTMAPVTSTPPAYVPPAKSSALPVKTSAIPMKDTGCTTTGRPSSTVRPVTTSTATRLPDVPGYVAPTATRLPDVPGYVTPTATRLPDVPGYVAPKQTRLPDTPGYVAPKDAKLPVPPVTANDSKKDSKKTAPKQKKDTDSGKNAPAYAGADTALPDSSNALEIDASYAKTSENSGATLQTSALAFGSAVVAALLF
ncbi:hypothetical protein MP638_006707 [Amoeboaphelidium occidentale]|nr:hypothetical protein MP638_006707 [Amoeboaphelidium occidentale]